MVSRNANVRYPFGDSLCNLRAWSLVQVHIDIWVRGKKASQNLRQELGRSSRIGPQADASFRSTGVLTQLTAHPFDLIHDKPRMMQQRSARRRRRNPTAAALQKSYTSLVLQAADPGTR
jgi:hypothetical protein